MADLPCDAEVYRNGITVAVVHSVPSETVEAWVRAVRGWAQVQLVDWHDIGGRARVAALGTPEELNRVREAARALLPALNAMLPALYPMVYNNAHEPPCAGAVLEEVAGG